MAKTKVLITVKTYPAISSKYDELVCTAGFREDGTWIRIFPIQFRQKNYEQQYQKYQWIEIDLVKNESDFRPESYRPVSHETEIKILGKIEPDGGVWKERRKYALNKVYYNLTDLIAESKDKGICTSLAVFKPTKVLDFKVDDVDREWSREKLARLQQLNLFEVTSSGKKEVVRKLPYKFSYRFVDDAGKESTLMIEDWEIGQLYWNCLARHEGNEARAIEDVRKKYMDNFANTKDLHLFLGTTQIHHYVSHNPFVIIGTFHPSHVKQLSFFD
ncbi:hypothetical protein [Rufibacter ruber]|uniref:hypothetical protein n=1 Tax=Rufibacter ruber TaxID=1783499 RepID=UPI00082B327C|nr:hypothetical protein [Rufibacter ruber]